MAAQSLISISVVNGAAVARHASVVWRSNRDISRACVQVENLNANENLTNEMIGCKK